MDFESRLFLQTDAAYASFSDATEGSTAPGERHGCDAQVEINYVIS